MSEILTSILFGLVQGVTEFLPVSSSGHLLLLHDVLRFEGDALSFDAALHLGTLFALLLYFYKDIYQLIIAFFRSLSKRKADLPEERLSWYILIGSIPAAVIGFTLESFIENVLRSSWIVVCMLIVGALLFFIVERFGSKQKTMSALTLRDSVLIGIAQALALVPGLSRSGITIIFGMARGFTRYDAARFSFLLSIPVVFGAGLKKMIDVVSAGFTNQEGMIFLAGILSAAVFGWFAIRVLLRFTQKYSLSFFGFYRLALAVIVAIFLLV